MGQVITIVVKDVANYTYLKQFQCYFTIKRNIFQSFFFFCKNTDEIKSYKFLSIINRLIDIFKKKRKKVQTSKIIIANTGRLHHKPRIVRIWVKFGISYNSDCKRTKSGK